MAIGSPGLDGQTGAGWGWIVAYGIVSLIAGVAAFMWPVGATLALAVMIGVLFLISGIFSIAAGFMGRASEGAGYAIAFGAVSAIIGLILLVEPTTGALSFTLLVVMWLAVRGALELYWATKVRRRRGWLIALGIINLLLVVYILATFPLTALTLPGFLLGISFIFAGVDGIMAGMAHRKGAPAFSA